MEFRTVYPFRLPRGYVDAEGTLHREGQMRPATAIDELSAMRDPRAKADEGYMERLLFSKVVIALGTLPAHGPDGASRISVTRLRCGAASAEAPDVQGTGGPPGRCGAGPPPCRGKYFSRKGTSSTVNSLPRR